MTLTVKSAATSQLAPAEYLYGIQSVKNGYVKEAYRGRFAVLSDVVRAVE